ncbi:MAG: hypothetical protein AAB211_01460 [Pseudomonadota bacterium]
MEHRDLKNLYDGIEPVEMELTQSRQRLAHSLEAAARQKIATQKPIRHAWFSWPQMLRVSVACVVLVAVSATGWRQYRLASFEAVELASLQAFVERNGDHTQLYREAKEMENSQEPLRKLNGLYILSALGQENENILASAQGLIEDPRAEFRAYYLDYLLTYADEAYYDVDYIEALIDRETDPDCIELLYELLNLAERGQRFRSTGV